MTGYEPKVGDRVLATWVIRTANAGGSGFVPRSSCEPGSGALYRVDEVRVWQGTVETVVLVSVDGGPRLYASPDEIEYVEHKIRWFVWAWNGERNERLPHQSTMRGQWGWDAECSCGWKTSTGGAVRSYVRDEVDWHKYENGIASGMYGDPEKAARAAAVFAPEVDPLADLDLLPCELDAADQA